MIRNQTINYTEMKHNLTSQWNSKKGQEMWAIEIEPVFQISDDVLVYGPISGYIGQYPDFCS